MQKPNFLIIGAARSGTTSLYYYLKQHPEIYMSPRKEPRFFAFAGRKEQIGPFGKRTLPTYSTSWSKYLELFEGVTTGRAIGEASTIYLYHPKAPERIHERMSDIKLIAVLRNPIDRALSHYLYNVRRSAEPCKSFEEALAKEEERIAEGWAEYFHYRPMGLYAEQLERYLQLFRHEQLKIYLYDDLKSDPLAIVQDIFRFLEVDPNFVPDLSKVYNPSGQARIPLLSKLLKRSNLLKRIIKPVTPKSLRRRVAEWEQWRNVKPTPKPRLSSKLKRQLISYYQEDTLKLQEMIGQDVSHWLDMPDEND